MVGGTRLRVGDVGIQTTAVTSVALRVVGRGLVVSCDGPEQRLALRFPQADPSAWRAAGGQPVAEAEGGQWIFAVPAGRHTIRRDGLLAR